MSKFDFVKKMDVKELTTRINTTGSEEFKKALQAELATRTDKAVEAPVETVEESLEETDTNVPVETEEVTAEAEEAPVKKTTSRSRSRSKKTAE